MIVFAGWQFPVSLAALKTAVTLISSGRKGRLPAWL
jgi:hypothetical protein